MKKRKVLEIVNSLGIGGNPIFVMNFFRIINQKEFEVDFLIFDDSKMDFYQEVLDTGGKVFICPSSNRKNILRQMKYVYYFLKNHKYDVVHCHNCSFMGILRGTLPAKLAKNIIVISHSHSVGTPKQNVFDDFIRWILKVCVGWTVDYGLACSDLAGESKYTKQFMKTNHYGIIHNAVYVEKFLFDSKARNRIRDQYQIGNKLLIGNIGRLAEVKNQRFLLEIYFRILQKNKKFILIIIGGGELEDELKKYATDLGIIEHVIFTGMVNNANEYYSAMDVFVMPSLFEGLPFTAVEAQVNGLKCVMADTMTQMVNISGDVKFLSLRDSVEIWADQILEQAQNRSKDEKVEKVCKEYDIKLEVKNLERYYRGEV